MSPVDRQQKLEDWWQAWQSGEPEPDWAALMPGSGDCPEDLLELLIHTDIEFRIKNGMPALLAVDYFTHPLLTLKPGNGFVLRCLHWELRLRRGRGDVPRPFDYLARFPEIAIYQELFAYRRPANDAATLA